LKNHSMAKTQAKQFFRLQECKKGNSMKQKKLAMGLSLAILFAFLGGGVALAKGSVTQSQNPTSNGDPVESHNTNNKGLKSPHSARKQAAKRLKLVHQQEHQQKLQNWAKEHQGYIGHGQAGDGLSNNQTPARHGGGK
jgi:hypothetical protein